MFRKRITGIIVRLLVLVVLCTSFAGCSKIRKLFGSSEEELEKVEMKADTVFCVGDQQVSLSEWYLYMHPEVSKMKALYGDKVFDYKLESIGKTMEQAVKEEIRDNIAYIKIVCEQADSLGISLTEDDMIDVNLQVEDYLLALSACPEEDDLESRGINEDLIRKVYSDNQLATKVYEYLTLNVDTTIPEDSVRYMVLQYIAILKYKVDASGNSSDYTPKELAAVTQRAKELETRIKTDSEIVRLTDLPDEAVSELIIDKSELTEKLGSQIAEEAFSLKEGRISPLIETDDAYFILDCISESDKEMTNAAKIAIIEQRQETVFEEAYEQWEKNTEITMNDSVYDAIVVK